MSEHMIELLIILSNLALVMVTMGAVLVTFFGLEKEHREEMLQALHIIARQRVQDSHRRVRHTVKARAVKVLRPVKDDDVA